MQIELSPELSRLFDQFVAAQVIRDLVGKELQRIKAEFRKLGVCEVSPSQSQTEEGMSARLKRLSEVAQAILNDNS